MDKKNKFTSRTIIYAFAILIIFSVGTHADDESNALCIEKAAQQANMIKSLPKLKYLNTLDGDRVLLENFYLQCKALFPWCCMFEKFYYWDNKISIIKSKGMNGIVTHKIRSYFNSLSVTCPQKCDPKAIYGDVAEFYDENGRFMGIVVYLGQGTYASLPYIEYKNN